MEDERKEDLGDIRVKGSLSDHVTTLLDKELGDSTTHGIITIYTADAVEGNDTDELLEIGAAVGVEQADEDVEHGKNVVYYRHKEKLKSTMLTVEKYLAARGIALVDSDQGLLDYIKYKV